MNILQTLKQLRDDLKTWVTNNLNVINTKLNNKVDREAGKGLSTNDFTNDYKTKLDNIGESGSGGISVETDPTVPGWAKEPTKPTYTAAEVGALPDTTPLFSGDYNDLDNAPNITEDSAGDLIILDKSGNIIFKVDANGIHATAATINDEAIATQEWVNGNMGSSFINKNDTDNQVMKGTLGLTNGAQLQIFNADETPTVYNKEYIRYVSPTGSDSNYFYFPTAENEGGTFATREWIDSQGYFKFDEYGHLYLNDTNDFYLTSDGYLVLPPAGAIRMDSVNKGTMYEKDNIHFYNFPEGGGMPSTVRLLFPTETDASGTIATREWVNAQDFGGEIDTSDLVSKSATSQQTLQSGLNFQNGGVLNIFGSNDTPVIFDRERIRYISSDGSSELNYFFNPENGGVNTIATRGYVDEKIAALRTELKAYIDEAILGGKW